jgi:hypothetical protein
LKTSLHAGLAIPLGFAACLALPSIQSRHPRSYADLVALFPPCEKPRTEEYEPCNAAAAILEAQDDPRRATALFLSAWGDLSFEPIPDRRTMGVNNDPLGDAQYAEGAAGERPALEAYTLPALREVYRRHPDSYVEKMTPALAEVDLSDKDSFKAFRKAHDQAAAVKVKKPKPGASPAASPGASATATPDTVPVIEL